MKNFNKKAFILFTFTAILLLAFCNKKDPEPKPIPITPQAEYTEKTSGEWAQYAETHTPWIIVDESESKENVQIYLNISGLNDKHYIEKIGIMDAQKKDLKVKTFTSGRRVTVSAKFSVPTDKLFSGDLKAFAKCNLHDLWTKQITKKNVSLVD